MYGPAPATGNKDLYLINRIIFNEYFSMQPFYARSCAFDLTLENPSILLLIYQSFQCP